MRLEQGEMDIEVRCHLRGDLEGIRCFALGVCGDPLLADDAGGILQGDQGAAALRGRDIDCRRFSGLEILLVKGEAEHGQRRRVLLVGLAAVGRPVGQEDRTGSMSAVQVLDIDQETTPIRIVEPERNPDISRGRSQGAGGENVSRGTVDIGIQFGGPAFPPPAPFHLENAVFKAVARDALSVLVHDGDVEDVVLVRFQRALRNLQADIGAVRGVGQGDRDETGVAALFLDGTDDGRAQHARSIGRLREVHTETDRTLAVQFGVDDPGLTARETLGRILEDIAVEALEGRSGGIQCQIRLDRQARCDRAGQPVGLDAGLGLGAAGEDSRTHIEVDFQPVGLDILDAQGFVEGSAADFDVGVPEAGRVFRQGRDVERVETVGGRAGLAGVELALRGVEFEGRRMRCREVAALVLQDHGNVQGVAGTPDAPFAVDEALQAFLDLLAADVEAAETLFIAVRDLEVADGIAAPGDDHEGPTLDGQGAEAVAVGLARGDLAELEIVGFEIDARGRGRRVDIRCRDPKLVPVGVFGHQTDIRSHQVDDGEALGQHVITRIRRVIALVPVVFLPVIPGLPIVGFRGVPDSGIFCGKGAADQGCQARGGRVDQGVFRFIGQPDAVNGAGFPPEERTQVDAPVLPGGKVLIPVAVQTDGLGIDQAAGAAQLFFAAQAVVLKEAQDIVFIDADDTKVYGPQADGPEG